MPMQSLFTPVNSLFTLVNSFFTLVNSFFTPVNSLFTAVKSFFTPVNNFYMALQSFSTRVFADPARSGWMSSRPCPTIGRRMTLRQSDLPGIAYPPVAPPDPCPATTSARSLCRHVSSKPTKPASTAPSSTRV